MSGVDLLEQWGSAGAPMLGIDPGLSGAVCLLVGRSVTVWDVPTSKVSAPGRKRKSKQVLDEAAYSQIIFDVKYDHPWLVACIEDVHAMPDQGVSSSFSFGDIFGCMRMPLACEEIPYFRARPTVWKPAMGCSADKDSSAVQCIQRFPGKDSLWFGPRQGVLDGRCEAALLALYGREKLRAGFRPW